MVISCSAILFSRNTFWDFYGIASNLDQRLDEYLELDDSIFRIKNKYYGNDNVKKLQIEKVKELIQRLEERKIYKCLNERYFEDDPRKDLEQVKESLIKRLENSVKIEKEDFNIVVKLLNNLINFNN